MGDLPRILLALLIFAVGGAVLTPFMGETPAFIASGIGAGIAIWTIPAKKKTGA